MKAMYVPFTKVSIDDEIQRMRDMFTSSEDLEIDSDGTITRMGGDKNTNSTEPKAKTVPKTIVSVPDDGKSVQDLIKEMRGDVEESDELETDSDAGSESNKKISVVPKGIVSATSVSDLINEMREGENEDIGTDCIAMDEESMENAEPKAKIVPKGIVS